MELYIKKELAMKKRLHIFLVIAICSLVTIAAGPNPPQPNCTFTHGDLHNEMQVGETYEVEFSVKCDIPFAYAMAMPDLFYPGRYVVAHGPDRSGSGTEATLIVPFMAKSSTEGLPEMPTLGVPAGYAPVAVVVGVRYKSGVVASDVFSYNVKVTHYP